MLKAFPDQWNINNFAKFACIARDREKAKELIDQVSGDPIPDAWGDGTIFENCKDWATLTEQPGSTNDSHQISAPPP